MWKVSFAEIIYQIGCNFLPALYTYQNIKSQLQTIVFTHLVRVIVLKNPDMETCKSEYAIVLVYESEDKSV